MLSALLRLRETWLAALIGIVASFLLRFSRHDVSNGHAYLSNGTHAWAPTVLLISLDGFKPEYLSSGLVPTLQKLANGDEAYMSDTVGALAAEYMLPASPSLTFPNHWTLQTGLLPSSHGIIANDFHLTPHESGRLRKNSSFYYTDPNQSWDPKWWKGVSIWEHLEVAGVKTANLMWPGPPITAQNVSSTHFQRYQKGWTVRQRHDKIVSWLDMPVKERPQFICAYAPDVDTASHDLGPDVNVPNVAAALRNVDDYVSHILQSIAERNASSLVNVAIVSDHGMTFTSNDRLVYLDDVLGSDLLENVVTADGWPNVGLRFRTSTEYADARRRLEQERRRLIARGVHAFDILERNELVERFNWTLTELVLDRTAPLWILPEVGWSITTRREMISMENDYIPKGNHGYDSRHPDMHALFLALGPAIRPRPEPKMRAFANVEIHNLVMAMLGVEGAPNDGTVGFWDEYVSSPGRNGNVISSV